MSADTVNAGMLRAFVERIERVEEEIKTLNGDKSEIYKEARGHGYDVKAIRAVVAKRKLDSAEREEREAIFDLYWSALHGGQFVHLHTRVEKIEEFDAETGEIKDDPETAAEVAGDYLREPDAADQGQIVREGDAPHETDRESGDASCPDAELRMDRATEGSFETGSEAAEKGREAIPDGPEDADLSHAGADESSAADERYVEATAEQRSSATIPDDDVPAFIKRQYVLRPHCQHPDNCGGYSTKHCHACLKARDDAIMEEELA